MQLRFLGCSDEHGVPRIGCKCQVCCSILSPESHNTHIRGLSSMVNAQREVGLSPPAFAPGQVPDRVQTYD